MMRKACSFIIVTVCFGLFMANSKGQQEWLQSRLWEKAKAEHEYPGPVLFVLYPENDQEIDGGQIRYAGKVEPGAKVYINDQEVKIYPSGAFAGLLELKEVGANEFTFTATNEKGSTSITRTVVRKEPVKSTPPAPLKIDVAEWMEPKEDLTVRAGDIILVKFKGSQGQQAWFKIGNKEKDYPMSELDPEQTNGVNGIYQGFYQVEPEDKFDNTNITFVLGQKEDKQAVEATAPARIVVDNTPKVIKVEDEYTPLYTTPEGWVRFSNVPEGVLLRAVGSRGDRIKVELAPGIHAWVSNQDISPLPDGTLPPRSQVGSIGSSVDDKGTTLSLDLTSRLPFMTEESFDPTRIVLTIFGGTSHTNWITRRHNDKVVKELQWQQAADDVYKLTIYLNTKRIWGYKTFYKGNALLVYIKNRPATEETQPLKDITVVLDPGHGGPRELGALGSTGLYEKDVNLYMSYRLKELLEKDGAQVILTRYDDSEVKLDERVTIAKKANADLFISIHNNSIGWSVNPIRPRGTSTFFYFPQSRELAKLIFEKLSEINPEVNAIGYVRASFLVLRQHEMPAVLLEGLFMSHPEDELMLMDPKFNDDFAHAVHAALREYLAP